MRVGLRRLARWTAGLLIGLVTGTGGLLLLYRVVNPPLTPLMLLRAPTHGITRHWVALEDIAPSLVRSVIAAEDARFPVHGGVDWPALRRAHAYNRRHGHAPRRGGSTITMQCARNVFLWPGKSYLRKALEVTLALGLERAWGKRRILEVYLNVIEWGPGLYGADAAARRNFGVPASRLTNRQAALLAAVLPDPRHRDPAAPTPSLLERAALIERRAAHVRLDVLRGRAGSRSPPATPPSRVGFFFSAQTVDLRECSKGGRGDGGAVVRVAAGGQRHEWTPLFQGKPGDPLISRQ